jgi:hypothetical protein
MAPLKNPRLAWSVALASLALWATSVPLTWGQITADATRLLDVTSTTTTSVDDSQQPADAATPCPPSPAAAAIPAVIASLLPTPPPSAPAPAAPAASSGTSSQGSFHLCGPDTSTAQAIEQLIAGRGFSASLSSSADGCADLMIRPTSQVGNGSATSQLSVSLGSGQNLQIRITSQNGATHVSIGSGQ